MLINAQWFSYKRPFLPKPLTILLMPWLHLLRIFILVTYCFILKYIINFYMILAVKGKPKKEEFVLDSLTINSVSIIIFCTQSRVKLFKTSTKIL